MQMTTLEVKSKGQVVATLEYSAPENLAEGVQVDTEKMVFEYYLATRKARAMNEARMEATGTGGIGVRELIKALKAADPSVLENLKAELGLGPASAGESTVDEVASE